DTLLVLSMLGHSYAASGKRAEAQKVLDELKKQSKEKYVSPYYMTVVCAGMGEKEQAIEWLQKAYEDKSEWLVWIKVDPVLDGLRSDPRFKEIMQRIGLTL